MDNIDIEKIWEEGINLFSKWKLQILIGPVIAIGVVRYLRQVSTRDVSWIGLAHITLVCRA